MRRQLVERTVDRRGVGENQRALTEIVQQQRRQHQPEPGRADGARADVTHVGIQRFRAGQRQEDATHHGEGDDRVCRHETDGFERVERLEDRRRDPDIDGAEHSDDDEPGDHDWTEQAADLRGPAPLDREQADQDRQRHRQDERLEVRRDQLEAFHCRQHRDGRRNHAVAVEQRRPDDAEQDQKREPGTARDAFGCHQGQQRQNAAFAVVVGAQDEDDVFERHYHHERPENERHDPENIGRRRHTACRTQRY